MTNQSGGLENREVVLDTSETPDAIHELFSKEEVVTVHSEEATLGDIFIKLTGRGLIAPKPDTARPAKRRSRR